MNFATPYFALFAGSVLGAVGQLLFKMGAAGSARFLDFVNVRITLGLTAYACSTLLWIWALAKVPLNVAYGFTALTFVIVFGLSGFVLNEAFTTYTYLGLGLVLLGFVCLAMAPVT